MLWPQVVILKSGLPNPQIGLNAISKSLSQRSMAKKIQVWSGYSNITVFVPIKNIVQILITGVLVLYLSQVIGKARVPIIKFVEKRSGLSFDIRFDDILLFDI